MSSDKGGHKMNVLDHNQPILKYFEEISRIPHGSYHEQQLSNYLVQFALKHQLEYKQDDMGNVIMYKQGTQGYEDHPAVMLQGHIDMVCEKNNDCDHDFDHDPLALYVEDGWLKAKGTTLGADDGYAVSYMLAVLESETIAHPPLVCVFTVQEEVGLFGASHLKAEDLPVKRMIGMDTGGEVVTCVSSSGGRRTIVTKPLNKVKNTNPTFELAIGGLLGGHSGGNINKERGNANKLAFRMLQNLSEQFSVGLVDVVGGLKENAIPRECVVTFTCDTSIKMMDKMLKETEKQIKTELEFSDPEFHFTLKQLSATADYCYDEKSSKEAIALVYLLPNGFKAKSMVIEGLTTVSLNLGVLAIEEEALKCYFSIRSPIKSAKEELSHEIEVLSALLGASVENMADYPGWNYEEKSEMRAIFKEVVKEELNAEMVTLASHGGLETGILKGLIPELDIVTMGPHCEGAHTPDEKMNLASFEKMFEVLKALLKKL